MLGWIFGRGASTTQVAQVQARITPELWTQTVRGHGFLARLSQSEMDELKSRCAWFLASKSMTGAGGFVLNDAICLSIAVQACLPILKLDPLLYHGWNEIIVYPAGFLIPREEMDEDGVVHEYVQEAAGEAWDGGPVVLSWEDAAPREADLNDEDGPGHAFNVVVHEFAHKLDLIDGEPDGMPALDAHPDLQPRRWRQVITASYEAFNDQLDAIEAAIPDDVDPESEDANAWYGQLPMDPYAATDIAEFFAVSSEAFFVQPAPLAAAYPDWYALLAAYYRQDPLAG
ncbi:zinc-dependent peptidase [Pigmentiphaga litoralis]|uniref:M90 family metallopeptidase n=1 Tax=Pigmentiphaga litoralis TaxID=516702 RepID=UPI003B43A245